ncbi:hypothetical protein RH915_07185 [Serpentinicella sp. ANB-PHB4]|uniref:hypothetical protein n=1 Tax=Serpentinicella sp. ANB-PHB4 TaxID=3074076 RepID=UPI0028615AEB|nr:hypothetical protein [Serpentinicella sp. ANB-PHB4]MDR5659269.1 hypothetical protein [Serpentinicella sp. ANB-PHB4]
MNNKQNLKDEQFNRLIKETFEASVASIHVDDSFKNKLLSIPQQCKKQSAWSKFLEREITLPLLPLSAFAVILIFVSTMTLSTFILPGELPEPEFEIIENYHQFISYENTSHLNN